MRKPVVDNVRLSMLGYLNPESNELLLSFDKIRNCRYVGTELSTDNPNIPNLVSHTKDIGEGERVISVPTANLNQPFYLIMEHNCSLPWNTRTVVGPIDMSKGPQEQEKTVGSKREKDS